MVSPLRRTASAGALVFCALIALASAGNPSSSHAAAAVGHVLGGVNISSLAANSQPAQADREIARARALGAKVVRIDLAWSILEPRAPGEVDSHALAFTDRLLADAASAGIRVIAEVGSTPCWASSAPPAILRRCGRDRANKANAWPPTKAASYATFLATLASRYGTRLAAIEIWNEPDQANQDYFDGPEKPRRYVALVRAAYPAIKRANPAVTVLAGSLVGSNGAFLKALYAAGMKGFYDGLAVHFYTLTLGGLRSIHEVQLANGDATPLWLDEFGWSSCLPRYRIQQEQACVTPQVQARNVTDVMRSIARARYVSAAVVYELQGTPREDFGVLSASGARKPAFAALASAFALPFGAISPVRVRLRRSGSSVIASGSAAPGDFMNLQVYQGTTLRYRAIFTLDSYDRYSLRLPVQLGTHGLTVRVYQYWAGPAAGASAQI